MDRNGKNLPVLYTIPRWKMELKLGVKNVKYYIPELRCYVDKSQLGNKLSKIGRTVKDWYNRWIMNFTVESQIPICKISGCSEPVEFKGITVGYSIGTCSNKDHRRLGKIMSHTGKTHSIETRNKISMSTKLSFINDPLLIERRTRSLIKTLSTPESKLKKHNIMVKRYKDENEHKKTSIGLKKAYSKSSSRENVSRAKLIQWMNPSDAMIKSIKANYGTKSRAFSEWEGKEVHFDSTWEDTFFNKCVEMKVESLLREPIRIPYFREGNTTGIPNSYYPDFLLNNHYLIEIKPNYLLDANEDKFLAADLYCRENGLEYVILTEDYLFNNGEPFYGSMPF